MAQEKKQTIKRKGKPSEKKQPVMPEEAVPVEGPVFEPGFPIVGIGASAGGLAAIELFFTSMPKDMDPGMAFVVVQHLDPHHKSMLMDLVRQYTTMRVVKVEDGIEVQANHVYIIPPNRDMAFIKGKLHLLEPEMARGLRLPIDFFFRSLAQDQHERAICIVLSGTGTDGTLGLKAIKGDGGMAMAQSPESAAYDGMPRSAIATGLVDYILPPDKMPEQLLSYVKRAFINRTRPIDTSLDTSIDTSIDSRSLSAILKVLILLRDRTGHDFSLYKQNTIRRRIARRMVVAQIDRFEDYISYLKESPIEVETLFRELLIGVTNFFRDRHAFEALQEHVFSRLFCRQPNIRIWVPGCSTGEEAYSIAIMAQEFMDKAKNRPQIQIFATDIDANAIDKARTGVYPESIAADVTHERLERFFTQEDSSYRIAKNIRDMVVFAKQDVLKDPPFSKLDMISCRNLLIYMGGEAQKRILSTFYYALNSNGYLFLGSSESIGDFTNMFSSLDKKWKLYQRKGDMASRAFAGHATLLPAEFVAHKIGLALPSALGKPQKQGATRNLAEKVLLEAYVPASVLINTELDVLYIHGHTGRYLEPAPGNATMNLLSMAREGLRMELAAAIHKAFTHKTVVRCYGVKVKSNGDPFVINIIVQPVSRPEGAEGLMLVIFEEPPASELPALAAGGEPVSEQEQRLVTLERELMTKSDFLQATIEELETTNEELKSTNEELQSSNEELQSTNEELETSKEELQSVNEELITVNTELQRKIEELSRVNNDMNNLLAGTNIGTLFLDTELRIQRFTPSMARVINFIQTDIGRPLSDIVSRFSDYDSLYEDTQVVLDTLVRKDIQVRTKEGQWYQLRIQPYRTLENVIEGAVLTFVEITELKKAEAAFKQHSGLMHSIIEFANEGIIVQDEQGQCVCYNHRMEELTGYSKAEACADDFYTLLCPDPEYREQAAAAVKAANAGQPCRNKTLEIVRKNGEKRRLDISLKSVTLEKQHWLIATLTEAA